MISVFFFGGVVSALLYHGERVTWSTLTPSSWLRDGDATVQPTQSSICSYAVIQRADAHTIYVTQAVSSYLPDCGVA